MFSSVLAQKPALQLFIAGGGIVLFVAWTVAFTASLHADSVRAGAAGLGLGLGAGFAALMAATRLVRRSSAWRSARPAAAFCWCR